MPTAAQSQKRARANTLGEMLQSVEATDKENAIPVEVILAQFSIYYIALLTIFLADLA